MDKNVVSLALFNLFRGLATGGYMALFSAYMTRLGYSMSDIGLVVTLSNIAGFLASPLMGYVLEVYSSRLVATLTGFMVAFSLVLAVVSDNMVLLALSYSLFMLSFYFGQPARMTFLARVVDERRLGSVVGVTSAAFTAARTIGPILGGFMVSYHSYQLSFTTLAVIAAVGSIVFYITSTEPQRSSRRGYSVLDPYKRILRPGRDLAIFYTFIGLDRAAWMLWFPMVSGYLVSIGFNESTIGVFFGLANLVETLGTPLMGRLTDSIGASRVLAFSEVTAAFSALTLALASQWPHLAPLALIFTGLSICSWIPAYNVYIARVYRSNMGETYATTNAIRSLAGIPASYTGGLLYDVLASYAPFITSATLLTLTTVLSLTSLSDIEKLKVSARIDRYGGESTGLRF